MMLTLAAAGPSATNLPPAAVVSSDELMLSKAATLITWHTVTSTITAYPAHTD